MNVVLASGPGVEGGEEVRYVEVQGTGERGTFDRRTLDSLLTLAEGGMRGLVEAQRRALAVAGCP